MTSNRIVSLSSPAAWLIFGFAALPHAGAQQDQPESPQKIQQQSYAAYQAGNYERFLKLSIQLHEMQPDQSTHTYNMACGYALTGRKREALKWLEHSIGLGFRDARKIASDTDFESIRSEKRFEQLVEFAKTGQAPPASAETVSMEVFQPEGLDPGKKHPLIVALHGYGRNPSRMLNNWRDAAEQFGAIVVAPQAPNRMSETAMNWGKLDRSVPLVVAAVQRACHELPVDPDRVVLTGFSQGGSLAYLAARMHPELFRGLIPVAARYTPPTQVATQEEPAEHAAPRLTKVFIMVGAEDRPSVLNPTQRAVEDFKNAGCQVKLNTYPGIGQSYPKDRLEEQLKALKFTLGD
jgi:predicted esterase